MLLDILQGRGHHPSTGIFQLKVSIDPNLVNQDRQVIMQDFERQIQNTVLYHKNKGNPLENCKKICDVIIFAMLETISDCCCGRAADRLLLKKNFFFKQSQMRDDGGLDLACNKRYIPKFPNL